MVAVYHFLSASCLGGAVSEMFVVIKLKEQEVAPCDRLQTLFLIGIHVMKFDYSANLMNLFKIKASLQK